jgi:hypothetical protein
MPFKKVTKNLYKSPSGRKFTKKQVELYYANDGKFPNQEPKNRKKTVKKRKD